MSDSRRIAVTGGRDFSNPALIRQTFSDIRLSMWDTIVHGGCRGTDAFCECVARCEFGADTEKHSADWDRYGRAAGPIRNREMLESGIDMLIAFPGGRGTANCVKTAKELGILVWQVKNEC